MRPDHGCRDSCGDTGFESGDLGWILFLSLRTPGVRQSLAETLDRPKGWCFFGEFDGWKYGRVKAHPTKACNYSGVVILAAS